MTPHRFELEENGITLHLTVVDTPGFGDSLNREENFRPILQYIMDRYEPFFERERSAEHRELIDDQRIHAALYFIAPGAPGLKELDIQCLKQLCGWVNVIPVIAKSDSLTREEIIAQKTAFHRKVQQLGLQFYPSSWSADYDVFGQLAQHIPFAVIGSDQIAEGPDKRVVRGRTFRWGTVEVDNPEHCDFVHLRSMLLQHSLLDLVTTTHEIHFSKFRVHKLGSPNRRESVLACDDTYEDRIQQSRAALLDEMVKKEDEMRRVFVSKVKEKEMVLREQEERLRSIRDQLAEELEQLKTTIEEERLEVEDLMRQQPNSSAALSKKK